MKHYLSVIFLTTVLVIYIPVCYSKCGCKETRKCYQKMLDELQTPGEATCVEDAALGVATTVLFLDALRKYCGDFINVTNKHESYQHRSLYEVVINSTDWGKTSHTVIVIDAGQDASTETVEFAMYIIEQLVSCEENEYMLRNARWVILPSTNPDGYEYTREARQYWKKNRRNTDLGIGVDITRNFDDSWNVCQTNDNYFSQDYPGPNPNSENETIFITEVLKKYKKDTKAYISFRRDGHALLYPHASINSTTTKTREIKKVAEVIAAKANQKGGVQWFQCDSIYNTNGKSHCGHSVDYAFTSLEIPYAFEMQMFLEWSNHFMSEFHSLPRGYKSSLRATYFNAIIELYKLIIKEN